MLWPIGISHEAEHAVIAGRCRFEIEPGFPNQCEVAAERTERDAEPAAVLRDGYRFAAGEERHEPDDTNETKGGAVALGMRKSPAAARRGFRRGRVELRGCHSVVYSIG